MEKNFDQRRISLKTERRNVFKYKVVHAFEYRFQLSPIETRFKILHSWKRPKALCPIMGRRLFFHTQPTVDSIYFSSPNFFEPPNNSNQKSFPSLQSNTVISPPISWNIRFSKQFSFSLVVQKIGIALYCGMET